MASPATQSSTAPLSDLLRQLQDLNSTKSFQTSMSEARELQPIDPTILSRALSTGGALSNAEDFATSNMWAMTPETFKSSMQARPDAVKTVSDMTSLSDAIFNRSGQRKSKEAEATALFNSRRAQGDQAIALYDAEQRRLGREKALAQDARQFKERLDFEKGDAKKYLTGLDDGTYHEPIDERDTMRMLNSDSAKKDVQGYATVQRRALKLGLLEDGQTLVVKEPTGNSGWFSDKTVERKYQIRTVKEGNQNVRVVAKLIRAGETNPITQVPVEKDSWIAVDRVSKVIPKNVFRSSRSGGASSSYQEYPNGTPE